MAYMSQEKKAKIAPKVKAILKKFGVKGSLSVHNHSTLVLKLKSGKLDFVKNYQDTAALMVNYRSDRDVAAIAAMTSIDVNPYHFRENFSGKCLAFMVSVFDAMNDGNHDRSDIQSDYFDVGWYVDVKVGDWQTSYEVTK